MADEPLSALDVSVQAQIVNLLLSLQEELGLAFLFISHDLNVMGMLASRVAVMYLGQIVEMAETEVLYQDPLHPYSKALLEAIPSPDPALKGNAGPLLKGELPNAANPPAGLHLPPPLPYRREALWQRAAKAPRDLARPLREVSPPLSSHQSEPTFS